ncbi:terminal protein, truncated [Streptomyces rochei]|nr:terminal protein, truncated [Streptomyces rochei]
MRCPPRWTAVAQLLGISQHIVERYVAGQLKRPRRELRDRIGRDEGGAGSAGETRVPVHVRPAPAQHVRSGRRRSANGPSGKLRRPCRIRVRVLRRSPGSNGPVSCHPPPPAPLATPRVPSAGTPSAWRRCAAGRTW